MARNHWLLAAMMSASVVGGCIEPITEDIGDEADAGASISALANTGAAWAYVTWNGSSYALDASRSHNPFSVTTVDNTQASAPYFIANVSFGNTTPNHQNAGTWMVTAVSADAQPVRCATASGQTHCVRQNANGTQTPVGSSFVIAYYRNNEVSTKTGAYGRFACGAAGCTHASRSVWTSAGGSSLAGWNMNVSQAGTWLFTEFYLTPGMLVDIDPSSVVNWQHVPHMQVSPAEQVSGAGAIGSYSLLAPVDPNQTIIAGIGNTSHANIAYFGAGTDSFPAPRGSYLLAEQATTASYFPTRAHAWQLGGILENVTRSAVGTYRVRGIVTAPATSKGVSFVTAIGSDGRFCNVQSFATDSVAHASNIRCFNVNGALVDTKYTVATFRF